MSNSVPDTPSVPASIQLGPYYEAIIEAQVKSGRYPNATEVLKDGLRFIEQNEIERNVWKAELRAKIKESRKDGRSNSAEEVFDRLEEKYQAMITKPS